MKFRTEIIIPKSNFDINYKTKSFFIGSCFSNNIGGQLQKLKFDTVVNPFGVLYNPSSVAENINLLLKKKEISEKDIFYDNSLWNSFLFHSSLSNANKSQFLENANDQIQINCEKLKKTNILFITWGTSWVYQIKETGKIAANCHKIPASKFYRYLLETEEIINHYDNLFQTLKEINPLMKIVLTVSPIRHWKDGAIGNQVSKSTLILAANKLVEKYDFVDYFPSYEIMMDDLRDYRFYDEDMLHPNKQAIDYIWQKFGETYFSRDTNQIIKEVISILNAIHHKAFNPNTESHQKFLHQTLFKIDVLMKKMPGVDLSEEHKIFEAQLI